MSCCGPGLPNYLLLHDFGYGVSVGVVYPNRIEDVSLKLDGGAVQIEHELAKLGQSVGDLECVVEKTDLTLQSLLSVAGEEEEAV